MKPKYITDNQGNKTDVIIPMDKYQKMLEDLDEFECIKAFDKAMSRKHEFLPAEEVFKEIEKKRARNHVSGTHRKAGSKAA